jgi:predicted acetyltransferase
MAERRAGKNLAPGWVAATFELAIVEMRIAGRLSVRHALNDFLLQQGGHIGYGVLPAFRGRGIGKRMLQRGIQIARAVGIERALVTCDENNAASRRIIEGAGGVYESSHVGADVSVPIRRYWFG